MEEYKKRMIVEYKQLDERCKKIVDFEGTETFGKLPYVAKHLMSKQCAAMFQYLEALRVRCSYEGITGEVVDACTEGKGITESDLVSFGNYLLSKEREATIEQKENIREVHDVDISNWKARQ